MKSYPHALSLAVSQALLIGGLSSHTLLAAQEQPSDAIRQPGFYTDSFHFLPEIEATAYYDDNIYATDRAKVADSVAVISPRLAVKSLWDRHRLDLDAGANLGRYADHSTEDYDDFWLSGEAEVDLSTLGQLYASAGFSRNHESRDSREATRQPDDELTTYDLGSLQAGVNRTFGATSAKLGLTYETLDYDNTGSLYNDDRDRQVHGIGLRVAHRLATGTQLYAQAIWNQRDYEDRRDQFGYRRDSQGYAVVGGVSRSFAQGHQIDAYIGQLYQDYDERRFDEVSELNYGLDLRWYPSKKTQLTGSLTRSLNETTEVGASSYLYSELDLQVDRKLAADFVGYFNYNRGLAEFQAVGREDRTQSLTLGLKYYLSPWVMLSGSFSAIDNDSNDVNNLVGVGESYDYERNLLFLTLRARLAP